MTKEEIGKILKELRINAGKTQIQVADQIGRSQQVIGHWETGYSQPDANTLFTLCDLYHADIDEAFGLNKNAKDRLVIFDPHEQKVITAYRAQPKMQEPVDRLLGIFEANDDKDPKTKKPVIIDSNLAAHGGGLLKAPSPPVDEHHKKVAEELEYGDD